MGTLKGKPQECSKHMWGFPKIRGPPFGRPYNESPTILGSILGPLIFGIPHVGIHLPGPCVPNMFLLYSWGFLFGAPGPFPLVVGWSAASAAGLWDKKLSVYFHEQPT